MFHTLRYQTFSSNNAMKSPILIFESSCSQWTARLWISKLSNTTLSYWFAHLCTCISASKPNFFHREILCTDFHTLRCTCWTKKICILTCLTIFCSSLSALKYWICCPLSNTVLLIFHCLPMLKCQHPNSTPRPTKTWNQNNTVPSRPTTEICTSLSIKE